VKVKKNEAPFFSLVAFSEYPTYDQFEESVINKLKIKKEELEAIVKGNLQIDDDESLSSLEQNDELIVYLA
jgi:hypothetical protein